MTPDSTFDDQTAKYARVAFWIGIPIWASFPKKMFEDGTKSTISQGQFGKTEIAFYIKNGFPKSDQLGMWTTMSIWHGTGLCRYLAGMYLN